MISSIDDLIYFLLERIALCSGLNYPEIETNVKQFYSRSNAESTTNPSIGHFQQANALVKSPPTPKVDGRFLSKVWQWLTDHPEIHVDSVRKETDELETSPSSSRPSLLQKRLANASVEESTRGLSDVDRDYRIGQLYEGLLLKTTDNRVWRAIAGHDVDHSRIPKLQFDLLRHIAAAGERGIFQPVLVNLSHQDKRSVPKRTDDLHQKGYIIKSSVRRGPDHTSLCILRKFAATSVAASKLDASDRSIPASPSITRGNAVSDVLEHKERFLDAAMNIVKTAGVITLDDFREKMGIREGSGKLASSDPWLHHMELVGCIQRVLATPSDAFWRPSSAKSLKFVSDITTQRREAYLKFANKDRQALWQESQEDSALNGSSIMETSEPTRAIPSNSESLSASYKDLDALAWQPQRPFENQLYDLIHEAGVGGLGTVDIVSKLTGLFAYRTVESILRNLSNVWQESQPPHLQHLALVRDTSMEDGVLHYRYWTYPNFDAGVRLGVLSWDAVNEAYESFLTEQNKTAGANSTDYLDAWGFPRLAVDKPGAIIEQYENATMLPAVARSLKRRMATSQGDSSGRELNTTKRRKKNKGNEPSKEAEKPVSSFFADSSGFPSSKVLKVHTDFEKLVWNQAVLLSEQEASFPVQPTEQRISKSPDSLNRQVNTETAQTQAIGGIQATDSTVLLHPLSTNRTNLEPETDFVNNENQVDELFDPSWKFLDKYERNSRNSYLETLGEERKRSLGVLYKNLLFMSQPGLYIRPPQRLPRVVGRPKSNLLVIIKSDRLRNMEQFSLIPKKDEYRLDPSLMFDIPRPLCEGVIISPSIDFIAQRDNLADLSTATVREANSENVQETSHQTISQQNSVDAPADATAGILVDTETSDSHYNNANQQLHATRNLDSSKHKDHPSRQPSSGYSDEDDQTGFEELSQKAQKDGESLVTKAPYKAKERAGVRLTKGSVAKRRFNLLVQLVKQAGGAYPGPHHLWYPYVTALRKLNPLSRMDYKTIVRAVNSLERSGKLKQLHFVFETDRGAVERSIVCLPELDRNSDIVRSIEQGIKEKYPQNFLPDGLEVDSSLKMQEANFEMKNAPGRRGGFAARLDVEVERNLELDGVYEDEDYNSEADVINVEQSSWQSKFQITNYSHQLPPQNRKHYGRRLGKTVAIGNIQVEEFPDDSEPASPVLEQHVPFSQFITAPETYEAERHEALREEQAFNEEIRSDIFSAPRHLDSTDPTSWLISWQRIATGSRMVDQNINPDHLRSNWQHSQPRIALCATLTDPDQEFAQPSGTFTTEFAVIRDVRPKLRLLTNIQRDYEDKIPNSLQEILHSNVAKGRGRKRKLRSFDKVVDAVQSWEQDNEQLLSSDQSLMVPRFINYPVAPEDISSTTPWDVKSEEGIKRPKGRVIPSSGKPMTESSLAKQSRHHRSTIQLDPQLLLQPPNDGQIFASNGRPANEQSSAMIINSQLRRIAITVIVVRSLLGGTDRVINQSIVGKLLPGLEWQQIRYQWIQASTVHGSYFETVEDWFQDAFIEAYERGGVPRINYNDADTYHWEAVIDWAIEHTNNEIKQRPEKNGSVATRTPAISFNSIPSMNQLFHVHEHPDSQGASLTSSLLPSIPQIRRESILNELPHIRMRSKVNKPRNSKEFDKLDVAKSYVRAILLTPETQYHPDSARARIAPFGDKILDAAIEELQSLKVIKQDNKGRAAPGRNFSMGKNFTNAFRTSLSIDTYSSAVQYKQVLDRAFSHDGFLEYSPHTSDGSIMALLNLRAAGRLEFKTSLPPLTQDPAKSTLNPTTGERYISIWGFTEGTYKTTGMDPRNLSFPLKIVPTNSWINGVPLPNPLPMAPAPHLDAQGNPKDNQIPLWYSIHDQFMPDLWQTVVSAVCTALALAPGVNAVELAHYCRDALFDWEIQLVIDWMQQFGIVTDSGVQNNAFQLGEWWWAVPGSAESVESSEYMSIK